jgi:hypothetical protein
MSCFSRSVMSFPIGLRSGGSHHCNLGSVSLAQSFLWLQSLGNIKGVVQIRQSAGLKSANMGHERGRQLRRLTSSSKLRRTTLQ